MRREDNSEDYDDPIKLIDCSHLLDAGIIENTNSERAVVQQNLKYKLSLKSCYMLPVSFFDIPRNISLLNECQPIRVNVVDYYKYPWYYKSNIGKSSERNLDNTIPIASDDDDSDIICLDPIDDTDEIPPNLDSNRSINIIDLTLNDRCSNNKNILNKRRNGKLDLELRQALNQKHSTDIDIKRNKGLIGMKIVKRVRVDDIAQDASNDEKCNNHSSNEIGNKNSTTKNSDTNVQAVDKVLERVGTYITPIKEDKGGHVTSTVNNQLENKPKSDNNKPNIICQLTNVPPKILDKFIKLKESTVSETKNNRDQAALKKPTIKANLEENDEKCMTVLKKLHIMGSKINNDLKNSEISSPSGPNFDIKSSSQDITKIYHKHEQSDQRPMPKCKKVSDNIKNKSVEVTEKLFDSHKTFKNSEKEISGVISPILPCNTAANKSNKFKTLLKSSINSERKACDSNNSAFEIHKNGKDHENDKALNVHSYPSFKSPPKHSNAKVTTTENKNDSDKEANSLKPTNSENNQSHCKDRAIIKECSEIAQKLLRSIVNHEICTPLDTKNTAARKENNPKILGKVDSNNPPSIPCTSALQTNSNGKPFTNTALKSESKVKIPDSGLRKVKESVENVKESNEYIYRNYVRTATGRLNMLNDTERINSAVTNPESIGLQRPMRTKTPHQHNSVPRMIPNLNANFGHNIPSTIPVNNNQATAIIMRPQLNSYPFNTNGHPIRTHTSCHPQYPKMTQYPTLDKLLLKTSSQANQGLHPPVSHLPNNLNYLPQSQNIYQYHNFVRHPPSYHGVAPNMAPVASSVFSNSFGAPNHNLHWNYGCPLVIPPPPPPSVQKNYNPNILTDIQPYDGSNMSRRDDFAKKNDILTTSTPPIEPEYDTKEGIIKLTPTAKQNSLITEKPLSTKSEMLQELERSMLEKSPERTDLENSEKAISFSEKLKLHAKPALLKTPSTKEPVIIPKNEYSPPILPIPTYQSFLSQVNSKMPNYVKRPRYSPVTPVIRHASKMNINPNHRKVRKRKQYEEELRNSEIPAKKISIEDYKKRSSDNNSVDFTYKAKQMGNKNAESSLKVNAYSMKYRRTNSHLDMQDLGYNSDTTGRP